ncbi:AIPR family protein [Dactylosporangium sp. AC04546]|uniref:AIPR family protein n=1 Tax=Dactylosporangium sp. AC04546 TaxID=2862460 RepID=UPI001EDE58DA|nr:AIPR family protein [Dactylosporangium sp. AC04546]WVK82937.1 AIPR family protein [Dactylosporangium sp. AC04546]
MSSNDVYLLSTMVDKDRSRSAPHMSPVEHQTFFVAKQYLKPMNPGHDDLLSGIVDGAKDCGIDAMYLFANSLCIRDDTPLKRLGRRVKLDLYIMQVKNTSGFTEVPIDKLLVNLPKLLDFRRDEEVLFESVNPRLLEITRRFLEAYQALDMPSLSIHVVFASLKADSVHPNIERKGGELVAGLKSLFGGCEPDVDFLDARRLGDKAREPVVVSRQLLLAENPISTNTAGGYVAVVRLSDYERFITAPNGELDVTLFEANVRDYEGDTQVNRSIGQTLENPQSIEDFWWLNNGVTIVASEVQPANKMLKLQSPQIVNGLQTSTEIFRRGRVSHNADTRSLLVKVIEARDSAVRDRIIRATNSQTEFGPSVLRATDRVQREIEEYLGAKGLYYERRRRYYFNLGKPVDRIVSIDEMGQAVLSVLVQRPDIARANPSKVYEPDIYEKVFFGNWDLAVYYSCIKLLRAAGDHLLIEAGVSLVDDFRYHLAMLLAMVMAGKEQPSAGDLAGIADHDFTTSTARELVKLINQEYAKVNRSKKILVLDRLAKDEVLTLQILERGREYLGAGAASRRSSRARRSASEQTSSRGRSSARKTQAS